MSEWLEQVDERIVAGRSDEALRLLIQVDPAAPEYRDAVRRAVHIAWSERAMSFEVERFFEPLLRALPPLRHAVEDTATLYWIGRVYERDEDSDSALVAYRAADGLSPGFEDVALRIEQLSGRLPSLPSLPDLPSLPSLPELPELPPPPRINPGADKKKPVGARSKTQEFDRRWRSPPNPILAAAVRSKSEELGLGPVVAGSVIADRFRVEAPIGEGGYGIVFRVTDLMIEEPLALKLFRRPVSDESALRRFKQEMRVTRRLFHPCIVKTYEFGTWGGLYFITMELLEGRDLAQELRRLRRPMPIGRAIDVAAQALDGLGAAHEAGVVHRDVKPENLFLLDQTDAVKVMDFGVARTDTHAARATATGKVVGTPAYIAPERLGAEGETTGPAGDVYAMGLVLYEMIAGRLPWQSLDVAGIFNEVLTVEPPPPSRWNSKVPPSLDALVAELLRKKPADRPRTAALSAERLRLLLL